MKLTSAEKEAVGVTRPLVVESKQADAVEEALAPGLEEKQLVVNADCVKAAGEAIAAGRVNTTDGLHVGSVERKALLVDDSDKSWKAFAGLHLAEDVGKPANTAMRYQHAVMRDGVVYAKALQKLAAGDNLEVAAAAIQLCKKAGIMMQDSVGRPGRGMFACPVMANGRPCPMSSVGRCNHLDDGGDCKIAGAACALSAGEDEPACPVMKAGEGCPMDQWSGCAQLNEDAECALQGSDACQLVKADAMEPDDDDTLEQSAEKGRNIVTMAVKAGDACGKRYMNDSGKFKDGFDGCVKYMKSCKGHSDDSAAKLCGYINANKG